MKPQKNNIVCTKKHIDLADAVMNTDLQKQKQQQKRTLSSYNVFYQLERKRLIHELPHDQVITFTDIIQLLEERSQPKPKRKHRTSHGKVSFTDMSQMISAKWRSLNEEDKELFDLKVKRAIKINNDHKQNKIDGTATTTSDRIPRLGKSVETTANNFSSDATKIDSSLLNKPQKISKLETKTNPDSSISDKKPYDNICLDDSFHTTLIEYNQGQCCFTNISPTQSEDNSVCDDMMLDNNVSHHDAMQHTCFMKEDYGDLFVDRNIQEELEVYENGQINKFLSKEMQKIRRRIFCRHAIITQHTKRLKAKKMKLRLNRFQSPSFTNDYNSLPIAENSSSFCNMLENPLNKLEASSDLFNKLSNANGDFYIQNSTLISYRKHQEPLHLEEKDWDQKVVPIKLKNYKNINHFQSMAFIDENTSFEADDFF